MCSTNPVSAKTAASVLQELMTKKGRMLEYECIGQSGLDHEKVFEYLCTADGVTVQAAARSKKDAKQAAARQALAALAARGETIPAPFNIPLEANEEKNGEEAAVVEAAAGAVVAAAAESTSYVALLKEFCQHHCEAAPEYSLVEETGPPHLRRFTMSAVVGEHKFMATASSKRAARQDAAAQLYRCLRENLATVSNARKKDDELVTANERAMQRYSEYTYWSNTHTSSGLPSVRSSGPPSLRNQTWAQYYDTGLRNSVSAARCGAGCSRSRCGGCRDAGFAGAEAAGSLREAWQAQYPDSAARRAAANLRSPRAPYARTFPR